MRRAVRRSGRSVRLRLGAPGVPCPLRRTAGALGDRRRDHAVAEEDRLAAVGARDGPIGLGGSGNGALARPARRRHLRGGLVRRVLRSSISRVPACSASATSASPRCWVSRSGWLGVRYVLLGFFAANLIGAAIGVALIASKRMSRQQQIPYGVFLAVGCAVAVFAGPELLRPFATLLSRPASGSLSARSPSAVPARPIRGPRGSGWRPGGRSGGPSRRRRRRRGGGTATLRGAPTRGFGRTPGNFTLRSALRSSIPCFALLGTTALAHRR